MTRLILWPRVEDGAHRTQQFGEIRRLLFQDDTDVRTGRVTVASPCGDFGDLGERQAKAPGASDEFKESKDFVRIHAVARRRTTGTRDDAARLVQPQSLTGHPTARGHVADEQAVHGPDDKPCPMGQSQAAHRSGA